MNAPTLNRRKLLKGLGGIAVGLPLLEEMLPGISYAAVKPAADIPVRAFNVFFGLGIPAPVQPGDFTDVLEPLAPLKDQLLILREVDQVRCDRSGMNAHFDGASGAFTATPPDGEARSGGASIDQLVRRSHYPKGLPDGMVSTLVGGTFFRRSRVGRYVHSYNPDGTVAATIQERPRDLFERVFGKMRSTGEEDERLENLKRSVLDSVVGQYQHYVGPNSPLGAVSKEKFKDHLDRIREYEQRAFALEIDDPRAPSMPPPSQLKHGGAADPGGEGIDITLDQLRTEWRLMADLYALAIQMDRARFGSITFLAAGERIRLKGDYHYNGKLIHQFDDSAQLKASGSKGCSHEWWHKFNEKSKNDQLRAHAHMKMNEVAYFLKSLHEGGECREANGKSILENSMLTISTESGDGRHNDVKRELSGVFHAVTGAGGRFKTGQVLNAKAEGINLYNTMLSAMDVKERLGPKDHQHVNADSIMA
ncbi:MAG: DUF1552 domain-containing protein [Verrucomicrobiales bacterium]|nr:DUF1552 domain-containing protein [Verrucomicrobiales bacterium]